MFKIKNPFRLPTADEVRQQQLEEAERTQLQHKACAEYHSSMASMLAARIERLRGEERRQQAVLQRVA